MPYKSDNEVERKREIREGPTHPLERTQPMTPIQTPNPSLQAAVDHARRLTEAGTTPTTSPAWIAQAQHVGDLSVLALALRG